MKDLVKVLANVITTFVTAYAIAYGAGLGWRGPAWILREPRAAGTAGGVEVADHHVVQENVVQAARRQLAANQMRVDVERRDLSERLFHLDSHFADAHRLLLKKPRKISEVGRYTAMGRTRNAERTLCGFQRAASPKIAR